MMEVIIKNLFLQKGLQIVGVKQITKGTVNQVFELVDTQGKKYIFRILRDKSWPSLKKLKLLSKCLKRINLAQAEIYFGGKSSDFPNGYVVQKYLEGVDADEVLGGALAYDVYYPILGSLLHKLHTIQFPFFGSLTNEKHQHKNYQDYVLRGLREVERDLQGRNELRDFSSAKTVLVANLADYYSEGTQAVLCHGDVSPDNVRWDSKNLVLIDWDNAKADVPEADLGVLFWWQHFRQTNELSLSNQAILLNSYGKQSETFQKRIVFQEVLHGLRLLPWYLKYDKRPNKVDAAVTYLRQLKAQV